MSPAAAPEPFTWARYGRHLDVALESGYRFAGFDALAGGGEPPDLSILLRHDVDYEPRWIEPMAALERERGIASTWFVLTTSPLYSLEDPGTRRAIEGVLGMGHALGLHFDASLIGSDGEVLREVESRASDLQDAFGAPVRAVSFHMPGRRGAAHLELPGGLVNTYAPRFFDEIGYISDSNQDWRGTDLDAELRARCHRVLQLLIHPFWWRERYGPILEKLERLAADHGVDPGEIITPEQREIAAAATSSGSPGR
jgi:hypothetical protein